jgi:hypothetical protein
MPTEATALKRTQGLDARVTKEEKRGALTEYIKQQAWQDVKKNVAAVFVLTPDGVTASGYYTLSQPGWMRAT